MLFAPGDRVRILAKGATQFEYGSIVTMKPGSIQVQVAGIINPLYYIEKDLELAEPSLADITT
jgi:hypothetical protein